MKRLLSSLNGSQPHSSDSKEEESSLVDVSQGAGASSPSSLSSPHDFSLGSPTVFVGLSDAAAQALPPPCEGPFEPDHDNSWSDLEGAVVVETVEWDAYDFSEGCCWLPETNHSERW